LPTAREVSSTGASFSWSPAFVQSARQRQSTRANAGARTPARLKQEQELEAEQAAAATPVRLAVVRIRSQPRLTRWIEMAGVEVDERQLFVME
jgi:hypothetical protein